MTKKDEKAPKSKKGKTTKAAPNLAAGQGDTTPLNEDKPSKLRKQLEVPGTAPPRNKKVEDAALRYRTSFLERLAAAHQEESHRGHLKMIMEQENVDSCRIVDGEGAEVVIVLDKPEAKIKMKKVSGNGDDEE